MVIANGFITRTVEEAYREVCNRTSTRVLPVPFPTVETMIYWLSEKGDVFGCQQMKTMCVTKPLKIERKYKRGCHMRYSIGEGKQKEIFMQNVMYSTFVAKEFLPELDFTFRDGNQYNYQLDNIEPVQPKVNQKLLDNMNIMKSIYEKEFNHVVNRIGREYDDIPIDDLKDIVSEAFFYLCGFRYYGKEDNLLAIWITVSEYRRRDYWKRFIANREEVLSKDGTEERFQSPSFSIETADIWRHIRGEKTRQTMKLYYIDGLTPTEIAKEMHSKIGTVGSCITRTTQYLKKIYTNDILEYKKK